MTIKKLFLMLLTATALTNCSTQQDNKMDEYVDNLYERMTDGERLAQLQSAFMDKLFDEEGNLDTALCRKTIPNGIGHFSQYASQLPLDANTIRDRVAKVQEWLMNNTPNGIPALFHEEVLSGINTQDATIYPQQIGQACSFNPELAELKTKQTGIAMRKMGGVLSLSPMVDVCRTPSFNRLEESYGEDGYLSAVMGTVFVNGLQQSDLSQGVGACSKHYLGYGGGGDAEEKEMMEEILLPHETMIRLAGSKAVMPGYHAVHGTNCVANSEILQDILRGYVGFDGMIVSDYTAIDQLPDQEDDMHKAAAAINGGNDVDFPSGSNYALLPEAIKKGLVSQETFERAVKNVLKYKYRAGLFDKKPYLYSNEDIVLDTDEERRTAYDIASQSIVLLENKGILPLRNVKNILLTGPNANSFWAMCGDYSYPAMNYFWKMGKASGENPHVVTLLEGMQNAINSISMNISSQPPTFSPQITSPKLMYSRGCDWTEEIETIFSRSGDERAWDYEILHRKVDSGEKADANEALALAEKSDVIIAAVGENVMLCGENRDRRGPAPDKVGLRLPGKQEEYVNKLIATGKPVVLVVFGGHAQVISGIAEKCAAVIQAWYPGEEGGNAVADILCGKISPSAKLSVSYPNTEIYEPICYNYSDKPDPRVAWPFGYGLSYTKFEYSNLNAEKQISTDSEYTLVSFDVENCGDMEADEIAQLYISPKNNSQNIRPIQLQGFARVSLKPGEKKTISVKLYTEQFGYYSNEGQRQWNIAPGTFTIKVGASSADIRSQQDITLAGSKVIKPLRDYYFSGSSIQ